MNIDLTGKTALVTGSGVGIGKEIAILLGKCGANVALNYRNSAKGSEEAIAEIEKSGGKAAAFQADVTDVKQINNMVKQIEETFNSQIDILVNNAGGLIDRLSNAEMSEELYEKVMDVNFKSTVFVTKAVLPGMQSKKNGKIVNVTSLAAHNGGGPGASIYGASKAAAMTYSKGLAKELAEYGINVNSVSPGFIGNTPFHETFTPKQAQENTINNIPLGRGGVPEDVANVTLFLVSELSSYLTGETIEINGGMFMR